MLDTALRQFNEINALKHVKVKDRDVVLKVLSQWRLRGTIIKSDCLA